MVNNDAIISIVKRMSDKKGPPCKKAIQKMVFLIEAKGIDLGCDYGIHFYGPYSADLDFAIRELTDNDVLDIDYTETGHKISLKNTAEVTYKNLDVQSIVDEFFDDTPSYLELLTTALYVYQQSLKQRSKIADGVVKIKGNKYNGKQIESAILRLEETGYIA